MSTQPDRPAHSGRFWTRVDESIIRCDLCPRHCHLREGQRAFCFVRRAENGQIVLDTYGRSTGFCIDPIEKKPLNHFLPGTPVLSFGTAGCNLGCKFCQNWDISKSREVAHLSQAASPDAIAKLAVENGCRSVAFTYNDPIIWAEYAIDTAIACRKAGIRTVAVTAGYITKQARNEFFEHLDAANVDLKAFQETFYRKLCFAELRPVLDTLEWLRRETNVWLEITTLLIPGENDSEDEVKRLSTWIAEHLGVDTPLHFSAFHPDFKMRHLPRTPARTLSAARNLAIAEGLRFVYTGNVHDREGDTTSCPGCGIPVIERDWYELLSWKLESGRCAQCGTAVPGVFEDRPGTWGAKRRPVSPS
ncbi:MAG: AmmeMemoRadiSam system radical SAM enzyme [Myxococcales bacterium]|nr:AmmeMemoRadiSam system radical SAM enzyme [Myxococcales bacterium]